MMASRQPYAFGNEIQVSAEEISKDFVFWADHTKNGPVVVTKRGVGKWVMVPTQVYREMVRRDVYNLTGIDLPFTPTFKKFAKVVAFLKANPPKPCVRELAVDSDAVRDLEEQGKNYGCPPNVVLMATMLCMMYASRLEQYPSARRA